MSEIYGGHLVAKYLKEVEGVETVFSLSGGHIDRIYDGFFEYGVHIIDVRHEQAAAMMAHAWSIYTGKPGVCLVTAGPGFTNALTGVANAFLENAPVVVLSGIAPVRDALKGALQEMNQADMIKAVVKWHAICHDIKRIPEYLSAAFRQAVNGRPGPVFLELPPDILNIRVSEDQVVAARKGSIVYRSQPDPAALKQAADMINKAEKPVIIGGSGIGLSDCAAELKQFIETSGIPFFFLNTGRGVVSDDHPLCLWDGGQMAMMTALAQADLVLVFGLRFNWLLMFGEGLPQARVIRVDIEAAEIDRNRASDIGLVGDLGLSLVELNTLVEKRDHSDWVKSLKDTCQVMLADEIATRHAPADPIHPARLVELVRKTVGDDALYLIDGGDTSYFGLMGLSATEKAGVLATAGGLLGCLGTGVPFGIGAKVARPEKTVVVINGDGSFGLNAMEFDTAIRHNIPIICVICNDQAWGMIKHGQEINYGSERLVGSELGVVHYEKMVEGLGGYGEFVDKEDMIGPALKRALESGKPACINVLTDTTVTSPATLLFSESLKME